MMTDMKPVGTPSRTPLHTRRIECNGYERSDGLWDIEGHLFDTRHYPIHTIDKRTLRPGDALHEMHLRVTVDRHLVIQDVQATIEHGPAPECPAISAAYQQLIGLTIGAGFMRSARELFKARAGCTHMTELLAPIATTALQTLWEPLMRENSNTTHNLTVRPALLDSCHVYRSDGETARTLWPLYTNRPDNK
jgi:hypothetical protein